MDNINDLLSSISPQDMEKLKSVAASLMNKEENKTPVTPKEVNQSKNTDSNFSSLFGDDMTKTLMSVASQMNKEDDRTAFIKALRPLLSDERRQKADEAARFLKLMDTLPLLKGLF